MSNKILIVDDDPDALDLLSLLLQRTGYVPITASNGESGLASSHREQPDLVLLDIVLPDMNGYQVLEALQASEKTKTIPVILISGKVQPGEKAKAHRAGADAYLERPFHPHELFRKIEDILGSQ